MSNLSAIRFLLTHPDPQIRNAADQIIRDLDVAQIGLEAALVREDILKDMIQATRENEIFAKTRQLTAERNAAKLEEVNDQLEHDNMRLRQNVPTCPDAPRFNKHRSVKDYLQQRSVLKK